MGVRRPNFRRVLNPFIWVWVSWQAGIFAIHDYFACRRFRKKLKHVEEMTEIWHGYGGDEEEVA